MQIIRKKKQVNLQIIQCGSIFISLFFPCLLKKLQKRERTCRAYMKVMERCFCPTLLAPTPPPSLYLRCRVDLSPSSAACSPLHCHVFPPSSPSFIFFLYLLFIYVYVFIASCVQAHILYYLRGSYLCSCGCLFSFATCSDSGPTFVVFSLFPFVSLLYCMCLP